VSAKTLTTYTCDGPSCGAAAGNYDEPRPKRWTEPEKPPIVLPASPGASGERHFCSQGCVWDWARSKDRRPSP